MSYNFTDGVRRTLGRAREEAKTLRHGKVAPEHILLALLADPEVHRDLVALDLTSADIRGAVEAKAPPGDSTQYLGELPYTRSAKRILELTMEEARIRNASAVSTRHLLLGVFREQKGTGAEVLREAGLVLGEGGLERTANSTSIPAGLSIAIDESSEESIYEQIIKQLTEAIATGRVTPGERLPSVRQLADRLDVAPGTVARAYSELERRSLLITDGARGTKVAQRSMRPSPGVATVDLSTLTGLLRPSAVAAFHLGCSAADLRNALEQAMVGIFDKPAGA